MAALLAVASILALLEARSATYTGEPILWKRLLWALAAVLGGAALLPSAGFLPVAFLGGVIIAVLAEGRFRWRILPVMALMSVAIWLLFEQLLGIRLP
ncbi:hypothetical protein GCM10009771_25610 [Nesterenkonia flava]